MTYQEKSYEIIKDSIKSAVFIDEKARDFYQPENTLKGDDEEILSQNLFNNFRQHGISLVVHKFQKGHEKDGNLKRFLFEGRDLVLLDWKLDGNDGEDLSLEMLAEVVKAPNINFCVVYTSQENVDNIYINLSAYFSGQTSSFYEEVKVGLEAYEDQLAPIFSKYTPFDNKANARLIPELLRIDQDFKTVFLAVTKAKSIVEAMCVAFIAYNRFHLSKVELPRPAIVSPDSSTLVINNTLIAILTKERDLDVSGLIRRLSDVFAQSENSFTQLLGFEMQSLFAKEGAFIDENLLQVSLEALLAHRKNILDVENSDIPFKILIKNVLIEHASLRLRTAKLALLENSFLDEISQTVTEKPADASLAAMNVFYNSVRIRSLIEGNLPSLDFGDVFRDKKNNYFICITALCDCYRPSKIDNIYYFAKGIPIDQSLALSLGDTAFISFLPNNTVVSWIAPEIDKNDVKAGEAITTEMLDFYKQYKYKPVYIKPVSYNVKSHKIKDNMIEIRRVETKDEKEDLDFIDLEYIATIRPNYTQRIANHAFSHPVRVGVDFVKR